MYVPIRRRWTKIVVEQTYLSKSIFLSDIHVTAFLIFKKNILIAITYIQYFLPYNGCGHLFEWFLSIFPNKAFRKVLIKIKQKCTKRTQQQGRFAVLKLRKRKKINESCDSENLIKII